jgi:2-hydroxy-3-keto-5-methylthiopentenyl-1-phosphate phosphatase
MIDIKDDNIRYFCAPVMGIEYLLGKGIPKIVLNSEKDYVDLRLLFAVNEVQIKEHKKPYMKMLKDKKGATYVRLTAKGVKYSSSNELSFMSERNRLRKIDEIPLYRAKNLVESDLDKKIINRCDDSLQNDCIQTKKFYSHVIDDLCACGLATSDAVLNYVKEEKKNTFKVSSKGQDYDYFLN